MDDKDCSRFSLLNSAVRGGAVWERFFLSMGVYIFFLSLYHQYSSIVIAIVVIFVCINFIFIFIHRHCHDHYHHYHYLYYIHIRLVLAHCLCCACSIYIWLYISLLRTNEGRDGRVGPCLDRKVCSMLKRVISDSGGPRGETSEDLDSVQVR